MLIDTLQEFERVYKKLWIEIRSEDEKNKFIHQNDVLKSSFLLENLIKDRIFQLAAFELLLKINKNRALVLLKEWYLSMDLSNHIKDQVSDLDIMLSDIKDILGEEQLHNILECPEFLPKNKKNKRVKEAISFALEDD